MRTTSALAIAIALVGCGPVWMFPGGELSGKVESPPADWSFSDAVQTIQLETRPGDPYSVNIWGAGVGENFYVAAGNASSTWAEGIAENPEVRLRIGDSIYELRAVHVEDDAEIDAFLTALQKKYDFEPDPEEREQATVYRLDARG